MPLQKGGIIRYVHAISDAFQSSGLRILNSTHGCAPELLSHSRSVVHERVVSFANLDSEVSLLLER